MRPFASHPLRVVFLLGKPARSATVLAEVIDRLRDASPSVTVHLPKGNSPLPPDVCDAALVVQRGLDVLKLMSARSVEDAGVRCCNPIAATLAIQDRAQTFARLAAAVVSAPETKLVPTWPEVLGLANERPIVVKTVDGRVGRGLGVLIAATGNLPVHAPFAGPYIAQAYVGGDGQDHKVYVAGPTASGLLKPWSPALVAERRGAPFAVDAALADLSLRVGSVLGLEIYGVDVLYGPNGPVVVDVNPFPGFRGVPRAAESIAHHLTAIATGHQHA